MREAAFIKQNSDRWQQFEKQLAAGSLLPDQKAALFIQLTDDLSFAQTQYPTSEITGYLNQLTSKIHQTIYTTKKEEQGRFITYWTQELPELFASLRKPMFYSFFITLVATAIGAISAISDDSFVRLILSDGYVNMTLENIKNGTPTGVYAKSDEVNMFFAITFNNIRVSFFAFAAGILFSVGTGYVLFSNGIMLGAFFALFYQHNLLLDSVLIVMLHGTLEISAIILAGGAGLRMGNSILFPGTYARVDSFRMGAKDGLKVVMGLMPVFIVAGFIESFITRYANLPVAIKATLIVSSLAFIVYYFFIFPLRLSTKRNATKN
jgi:uncharacterized membrane protein SpoIIM required for sporulation